MPKVSEPSGLLPQALGAAWLAVFLFLVLCFGSVKPLDPGTFAALALAGLLYAAVFETDRLRFVLATQRLMLASAVITVLTIIGAGWMLALFKPDRAAMPLPAQIGLLLCIAPLAVVLSDRPRLKAVALLFAAITLVHVVALPIEAITGDPVFSWGDALYPRELGPLRFQARGLAWQVYYFPGLLMSMFYLVAGLFGEECLFGTWTFGTRSWLAVSLVWTGAVACLQSRSALAGALAAALIGMVAFAHLRRARLWLAAAAVGLAGAGLYWYLFSGNKSSGGLRWSYLLLYLQHSFDTEWLWTGRGYTVHPDTSMQVGGLQFVHHSHNDFAQVFFTWGLPALLAYLLFWFALVRLAIDFWREKRYWPMLALIAVGPSFMTDLGMHHLEKAAFLAVLAGMAAACTPAAPAKVSTT